ncbi:MAG TPA: hypothetical protein VHN77_04260, partial [Phycisphaerales bacterium]|nr:hypothetical protein [Phycisphaerales bacterium]
GAGLGCVLVGLSRVEHVAVADVLNAGGWAGLIALPVAAGAVIGAAVSALRWSSTKRGALALDERLGLRDRLTSALELSERRASAVEQLAIADAEAIAGRVSARNAVRVRPGRAWLVAVPFAIVGVGLWKWMPSVALWTPVPPTRTASVVQPEAKQQAAEAVKDAARAVEQFADTTAATQLEALKRVEEELAQPRADRDSVTSAARAVGEAGESMTKQAARTQAEQQRLLDAMAERSRSADGSPTPRSAEMERLASALRRQDAAGAAEAAREASERFDQMAPAERAAAEDQLRELAAAMEEWDQKNAAGDDAAASTENGSRPDSARPAAAESGKAEQSAPAEAQDKSKGQPGEALDERKQQGSPPDAKVPSAKDPSPAGEAPSSESAASSDKNAQGKAEERTPKDERTPANQNAPRDAAGAPPDAAQRPREPAKDAKGGENATPERSQGSPTPREAEQRGAEQPRPSTPGDAKDTPQSQTGQEAQEKRTGSESAEGERKEQPSASARKEQTPGERSKQPGDPARPQDSKSVDGAEREAVPSSKQDPSMSPTPDKKGDESGPSQQENGKQPPSDSQPRSQPGSKPDPQKNPGGSPAEAPSQQQSQGEESKDQGQPAQGAQEKQAQGEQQASKREDAQQRSTDGNQRPGEDGADKTPQQNDANRPGDASQRQDGQPGRPEQSAPKSPTDGKNGNEKRPQESGERGQEGEKENPRNAGGTSESPAQRAEKSEGSTPRPDEKSSGENSPPSTLPPKEVLEKLAERLKNSEAAQRQAREMMQRGKGLEEQARKMLEQASPEQRQVLEKLARELAQGRPGDGAPPPGTGDGGRGPLGPSLPVRDRSAVPSDATQVPVDARHSAGDGSQRVISDIMNDEPTPAGAPTSTAAMERAFQQAAAGAESGIENQSVPADRSDLVRRVFRRYQDRVKQAEQGGSPK